MTGVCVVTLAAAGTGASTAAANAAANDEHATASTVANTSNGRTGRRLIARSPLPSPSVATGPA